ncbi:hypothetical protein ILP92_04310 [Maribius pontilimi]|uniref:PRC-barrel domain-containing protein n=1 Tax=Palleronia pontilimi TaxID=1964209 RepID=A0A934MBY9_9RHOB|nr:hypothetical protein [Palleronia pontilimi]MBJ3761970.1 hypothetical protein [Palleronia pontilimi]
MRTYLMTVAAIAALIAPASAQVMPEGSVTAGAITGGSVYQSGPSVSLTPGATQDAISSDWNQIGTISDVVLSSGGELIGILATLEMGEVFLPVESANLVAAPGQDFAFVTDLTLEELQGQAQ